MRVDLGVLLPPPLCVLEERMGCLLIAGFLDAELLPDFRLEHAKLSRAHRKAAHVTAAVSTCGMVVPMSGFGSISMRTSRMPTVTPIRASAPTACSSTAIVLLPLLASSRTHTACDDTPSNTTHASPTYRPSARRQSSSHVATSSTSSSLDWAAVATPSAPLPSIAPEAGDRWRFPTRHSTMWMGAGFRSSVRMPTIALLPGGWGTQRCQATRGPVSATAVSHTGSNAAALTCRLMRKVSLKRGSTPTGTSADRARWRPQ